MDHSKCDERPLAAGIIAPVAGGALADAAPVFCPQDAGVAASQLTAFMRFCSRATGLDLTDPAELHELSVRELRDFWRLFLDWSGLLWEGSPEPVCTGDSCEHAAFFPDLRLSYAENLLSGVGDSTVLVARHGPERGERITRGELRDRVRGVAGGLTRLGLRAGDRTAAVAGNNAEAIVAALAATAVGATFSSAAPDMGAPALLSRFEQLDPKVLFVSAELSAETLDDVVRGLPGLLAVVRLDDLPTGPDPWEPGQWPRFPFNHPLFVLFTSGTTGSPKCLVHGAGGTLLEHVKEHRLHCDLRAGETLFFHTSAAWMMWNWQLSALASGAAIVAYDGPLTGPDTLWRIASEERAAVFGTSPPYLQLCEDAGWSPGRELDLASLRAVLSTGSILHDWQYDWVRDHVGHVPVQSISGGTDIIGCFVLGNPNQPVRRGWIQCRSLGLDVQSLDGELVCRNPFPSRPLGLLGDDGSRFHETYFAQNPGVWTHGDLLELDDDGQARLHGRSDGVVQVRGVRIGPAEIYRALHGVAEVLEAVAVEQRVAGQRGQSRLVLLVVLRDDASLDGRLAVRIRREIATHVSPTHVPQLVVQVAQIPTTHSGKRSERAVRDAANGVPVANAEALRNPEALEAIEHAIALADERAQRLAAADEPGEGATTEERLRAIWESVLGVAPLLPDDDFFDVGGTSLAALTLIAEVHDRMGVDLPLSSLLYAPTTAAMAAVVDGPAEGRAPAIVLLRPGRGRPLFIVHSAWGDVLALRPLARALHTERPVYGLQARGLDLELEPHDRVEEMAASYVDTMLAVQPKGPFAVAGYSFGGLVALEMARLLSARGHAIEWLGLLDSSVHHDCLPPLARLRFLAGRSLHSLRARLAARTRLERYSREGVSPWVPLPRDGADVPPVVRRMHDANGRAFAAYRPRRYEGGATFVSADTRATGAYLCDPVPVWRRVVRGGLDVEQMPGAHEEMVGGPHVGVLAELIDERL